MGEAVDALLVVWNGFGRAVEGEMWIATPTALCSLGGSGNLRRALPVQLAPNDPMRRT